jgi:hypothetical protein
MSISFALVLPPLALLIGWIGWTFKIGAIAGLATFAACLVGGGTSLSMVRNITWVHISIPFLLGCIYSLLPDAIPIPIDDAAAVGAGAIVSLLLAWRKYESVPAAATLSLLAAAAYTLVGDLIPGPADELLVYCITGGIAYRSVARITA